MVISQYGQGDILDNGDRSYTLKNAWITLTEPNGKFAEIIDKALGGLVKSNQFEFKDYENIPLEITLKDNGDNLGVFITIGGFGHRNAEDGHDFEPQIQRNYGINPVKKTIEYIADLCQVEIIGDYSDDMELYFLENINAIKDAVESFALFYGKADTAYGRINMRTYGIYVKTKIKTNYSDEMVASINMNNTHARDGENIIKYEGYGKNRYFYYATSEFDDIIDENIYEKLNDEILKQVNSYGVRK